MPEDEGVIVRATAMDDGEVSIVELDIRVSRTRLGKAYGSQSQSPAGWPPTLLPSPSSD